MKANATFRSLALIFVATAALLPSATTPCLAQSSVHAPDVPATADTTWHKLSVKYMTPSAIVTTMHWTDPMKMPEGVMKIYALEEDDSLFIQATSDGFSRIKDIVQNLDVKSSTVQVKIDWLITSVTDIAKFHYSNKDSRPQLFGSVPPIELRPWNWDEQFFAFLKDAGATSLFSNTVTIKSNVPTLVSADKLTLHNNICPKLEVNLRVNSDQSITLLLVPKMGASGTDPVPMDAQVQRTLYTIAANRMAMLENWPWDKNHRLLVFVTPTLLPDAPADSMTLGTPSEGASP